MDKQDFIIILLVGIAIFLLSRGCESHLYIPDDSNKKCFACHKPISADSEFQEYIKWKRMKK